MEFELTIRGNANELPEVLKLLGEHTGSSKLAVEEEGSIPTRIGWTRSTRQEFWNDISFSAAELMGYCCVLVPIPEDAESPPAFSGAVHRPTCGGIEDCDEQKACENWEKHFRRHDTGLNGLTLQDDWGIKPQSVGARLANISRTLKTPKYAGLPDPISRRIIEVPAGYDSIRGEEFEPRQVPFYYMKDPEWREFVLQDWGKKSGYVGSDDLDD